MKKMLASLLLLLPAITMSQEKSNDEVITTTKKVVCLDVNVLLTQLSQEKELLFWAGADKRSYYALFVNEKTKSWTLIQFNKEVGCVIGMGDQHTHVIRPNS